jgi:hypothetical protein
MDEKPTRRGKQFKRFEDLARQLVRVPKKEIDAQEEEYKKARKRGSLKPTPVDEEIRPT